MANPLLHVDEDDLFEPLLIVFPKDNLPELNIRLRNYYGGFRPWSLRARVVVEDEEGESLMKEEHVPG